MQEDRPEQNQENHEINVDHLLDEISQQDDLSALTPAPETSPPQAAKITAPLPELTVLATARVTAPLPELEFPQAVADTPATHPPESDKSAQTPDENATQRLPDLQTVIHFSPRLQRVLLYLARRRLRQAATVRLQLPVTPEPEVTLEPVNIAETNSEPDLSNAPTQKLFPTAVPLQDSAPDSQQSLAGMQKATAQTNLAASVNLADALTPETIPDENVPTLDETTVRLHPPQKIFQPDMQLPPVQYTDLTRPTHPLPSPPALPVAWPTTQITPFAPPTTWPSLPLTRTPMPVSNTASNQLQPYRQRATSSYTQLHRRKRLSRLQYFSRKNLRKGRASDHRATKRLWTIIWSTSSSFFLLFTAIAGIIGYIAYDFISTTQGTYASQVLTLRDLLPPDNLKIYDSQGLLIDQLTDQGIHTEVKYAQIAPNLVNATVAIEDQTFWTNSGVDITGILRSALADLENGQPLEGGSTITQQLIKLLIPDNSPAIIHKLSEIVLAPQVNNHYSKSDIMEMYLNTIYYGYQAYGIDAAATAYFGLNDKANQSAASQLDLAQSAMLAGLPRNASLYDPFTRPQDATARLKQVLDAMVSQNYISRVQEEDAEQEAQSPTFFKSSPALEDQAPHFDNYILTQLEQIFHLQRSQLSRSGLVVYTTLDLTLQNKILKVMQQHVAEISQAHHVTNAAEVLIDFHTGAIISMLGSIDYYNNSIDGQYNVALAYRQPGSSFKPYVYVTAFEQGASPAQAIDDAPTTFNNPGGDPPLYTPSNYDLSFHGHMTLRCALQNSLNIPAVRVLQHVGVNNALQTAESMGITTEGTPGLSMVLGGLDVRLLDHTSAIGTFADNGVHMPDYSISKIVQGTTSTVLYQHTNTPGVQVITPQLAYMMTNVLSDNTSRTPEFFDCNVLQLYANSQQDCYDGDRGAVRPAAAKTGTTQNFRDNWTVGYTTDYVMGVWAGNDDNSAMINVTGVQGAAPIWHDSMLLAEQGHPIRDFQNPGGLVRATVTYPDGVQTTDLFLPGTVPNWGVLPSTPNPNPGRGHQPQPGAGATPAPYCSTFSLAFTPPAGNGIPANDEWW